MNRRNNEEIWAYTAKLREKLTRAKERCHDVAWSEQMFGYLESARVYTELEEEMTQLSAWVQRVMEDFLEVK